jgi:CspA family cold shock protein
VEAPLRRRPAGRQLAWFVRFSAIQSAGFRSLTEDQRVEFDIAQGPKGPQAQSVTIL